MFDQLQFANYFVSLATYPTMIKLTGNQAYSVTLINQMLPTRDTANSMKCFIGITGFLIFFTAFCCSLTDLQKQLIRILHAVGENIKCVAAGRACILETKGLQQGCGSGYFSNASASNNKKRKNDR